jgi:uncharacterized membrane protein
MAHCLQRYWRHWRSDHRHTRAMFPPAALSALASAVQHAEAGTSGEIRVCIEPALPWSYLHKNLSTRDRAITLFGKLRVWDTEHNNGVLIYVNAAERRLELVCDRALARVAPAERWQQITQLACDELRAGRATQGVEWAVLECGRLLKAHFASAEREGNPQDDAPVML